MSKTELSLTGIYGYCFLARDGSGDTKLFWPPEWWGTYFLMVFLIVPLCLVTISIFWFGIGGIIDLVRMFRDLKERVINPLDDGRVKGHVSLADKAELETLDKE